MWTLSECSFFISRWQCWQDSRSSHNNPATYSYSGHSPTRARHRNNLSLPGPALCQGITDTSSHPHNITTLKYDFHSKLLTGSGFVELFSSAEFCNCKEGARGKGEGFGGIYSKNSFQFEIDLSSFLPPPPPPQVNVNVE